MNWNNEMNAPRVNIKKFKGTYHYASLSCHKKLEQGPKDDCESWFYLLLQLVKGDLPWDHLDDREEVLKWKKECREKKRHLLFEGIPRSDELNKVLHYIDSRKYQDRVDYDYIYKMLRGTGNKAGVDIDGPFDWENATTSQSKN